MLSQSQVSRWEEKTSKFNDLIIQSFIWLGMYPEMYLSNYLDSSCLIALLNSVDLLSYSHWNLLLIWDWGQIEVKKSAERRLWNCHTWRILLWYVEHKTFSNVRKPEVQSEALVGPNYILGSTAVLKSLHKISKTGSIQQRHFCATKKYM